MASTEQVSVGGLAPVERGVFRVTAARKVSVPAAPVATDTPKVLRLGVIQGGRIIEERIVRKREDVSIGQSEKNTFVIAHPKLPARFVLFELKGGRYQLNIREFMEGKVFSPAGVQDLAALQGVRSILLDERSRGRISIGDTTVLFQFVVPPPVQPRPQLPAALRGGWFKAFLEDWFFNMLLFCGLICHVVPILYLIHYDWPVKEEGLDLDNRYLQLVLQPPEEDILDKMKGTKKEEGPGDKAKEEVAKVEEARGPTKAETKGPKRELTEEEKAALEAQRRARLEAQVSKSGILAVIGSVSGEASGSAGVDLLAAGSVDTNIDDVMKTVSGVRVAGGGDVGGTLRMPAGAEGGGRVADIGPIRVSQADAEISTAGPDERKVKANVKMGGGSEAGGTGILDAAEVNRVVRSRLPAIKMCYERALRRNPTLEGKISVHFTIGTTGRVTSAKVAADTINDSEVTSCVLDKVKSLLFTKPEGGSVDYVFPFVFKPSG